MSPPTVLRRPGAVLLAAGVVVILVIELALSSGADEHPLRGLPSAAIVGAGLLLRRRLPVVGFVLAAAGLYGLGAIFPAFPDESLGFVIAYFVVHYSLGRWTDGAEAWGGAALVLISMVFFASADARVNDVALRDVSPGSVAFATLFVAGPWAAGLVIRLLRGQEGVLREENQQLQLQHARAVAEERSRIARELHDVVSHAISVTVLQARGARRTLDSDPDAVRRALDAIEQTNTAALGDMRRLLSVLRETEADGAAGDELAPQPSLAHLDQLVAHVRDSGVPVEVEVVGEPGELPPGVDLSAYRIVQEALTNVLKHTTGARATVRLEYADTALTVVVADTGVPPAGRTSPLDAGDRANERAGGHGLLGIRERVAVAGGGVEAGPSRDGYRIRARLPYSVEAS